MDPLEVKKAVENRPSAVGSWTKSKWYLCGDAKTELFSMFKAGFRESVAVRLTAYDTPAGGSYAVISHQIYGWTHRFVLPLYEPKVRAMLLDLQSAELGFMFGNEGEEDAVLLHCPLGAPAFLPLLAKSNPLRKSTLKDVLAELPQVIRTMNVPNQVPSLRRGECVTDVSVSAVLPTQAMIRFLCEKAEGMKA